MQPSKPVNLSRERVLTVAEKLFSENGYDAVTLRDIANTLGMKQASLYYHVPGGKEALFVEVTARGLRRHQHGLENAIQSVPEDLRLQLQAASRWLISQPILNYGRMLQSDMPAISPEHQANLTRIAHSSLIMPLEKIFAPVVAGRGEDRAKATYLAGAFLSLVESVYQLPESFGGEPKQVMIDYLIDVMVRGLQFE